MSAKKERPKKGEEITPEMSLRDMAAALGTSTAELSEWKRLAQVPEEDFEAALAKLKKDGDRLTARAIIRGGAPVRALGRVERAAAIYRNMTPSERLEFLTFLATFKT